MKLKTAMCEQKLNSLGRMPNENSSCTKQMSVLGNE